MPRPPTERCARCPAPVEPGAAFCPDPACASAHAALTNAFRPPIDTAFLLLRLRRVQRELSWLRTVCRSGAAVVADLMPENVIADLRARGWELVPSEFNPHLAKFGVVLVLRRGVAEHRVFVVVDRELGDFNARLIDAVGVVAAVEGISRQELLARWLQHPRPAPGATQS